MEEWYKTWFSSSDYLLVYRHRNNEEAAVFTDLLLNKLRPAPGCRILDLGCGAGRYANLLAQKGFSVVGVDLSPSLLQIARQQAGQLGLGVTYIESDFRHLNLQDSFEVITNIFTSFGYSEDDKDNFEIFKTAFRHLSENGYFIFDYFNKDHLLNTLIPFSVSREDGVIIEQFRWIDGTFVKKRIVLQNGSRLQAFMESVKIYSADKIVEVLKESGFKVICSFGDYYGTPFSASSSPRLILICQKE